MRVKRHRSKLGLVVIFLIVAAVAFFGVKYLFGNLEISREYNLDYGSELTDAEKLKVASLLDTAEQYALPIKLSVKTTTAKDDYTISELVPVTDWYSTATSISAEDALNPGYIDALGITVSLIPPSDLDGTQKLLSLDDHYYLDDPSKGALYRTLELTIDETNAEKVTDRRRSAAESDLAKLKSELKNQLYTANSSDNILTFAQTGVTALSRAMVSKLNQVGDGAYFAANIKDFLSSKDLTHISNEVSFADNCPGGTNTVVLCSDWRMLDAIAAIGTDIIELTGNHNNDYSTQANLNTIAKYEELGLKTFGGGKDEETARIPLQLEEKSTNITLIGFNNSTTTAAYGGANGNTPGANLYSEEVAKTQIAEAKARGDFVIVDIQYFECYCYPDGYVEMYACDYANGYAGQQSFFRHLIDLGADMVVGTQAHQPQTFELYDGKPIYYGLGNLFFDQTYWPGTTRGLILTHYFLNGKYAQTTISPTAYDNTYQTRLMDADSATSFLTRLLNVSPHGE